VLGLGPKVLIFSGQSIPHRRVCSPLPSWKMVMVSPSMTLMTLPDHAAAIVGKRSRATAKSHGNLRGPKDNLTLPRRTPLKRTISPSHAAVT
jgi:hypothetical protein